MECRKKVNILQLLNHIYVNEILHSLLLYITYGPIQTFKYTMDGSLAPIFMA